MTIPIINSRSLTQDLYVQALSSVYAAGWRIWDPDYASSKEADIYEKCRRDPVIAQAIDTRLHGVSGRQWRLVPASDDPDDKLIAKMGEQAIKQIRRFTEARYELAQAVIRSSSYGFIEGDRRLMSLAGTPVREWWVPTRIKDIDRRRFRLMSKWDGQNSADRKLNVQWEMYSVTRHKWERLSNPELFVKVIYNDEEARLGYGRGLLEAIYFYKWIKDRVLEEGIQGVSKWARGTVVINMDDMRQGSAGADDRSNDDVRNAWSDAVAEMLKNHNIIMGKEDKVQLVESTGTGHQIVKDFLLYLDGAIMSLILGSKLPFGGGDGGGSFARAEVEENVHESLIQFDREKIDEDITYDLVGLWIRMNRANFVELGLGGAQKPTFETTQEKREDPEKNARVIQTASSTGIDLRKDEVYKKLGFTPPQKGDEIIEGRQASANPFGSPFDSEEFDQAMGDPKTAAMARVLMKAGSRPDEAVRCAVEAGKASEPPKELPPPPPAPAPHMTFNNPVTVHSAAAPPQQASGPITVNSPIHLPEKILLEAAVQPTPQVHVTVQKPDPIVVNVSPTPISVQPPNVDVRVSAPNVSVEAPRVTVNPVVEVKLPESIPFKLELPPMRKKVEFTKDKNGLIEGAEITTKRAD